MHSSQDPQNYQRRQILEPKRVEQSKHNSIIDNSKQIPTKPRFDFSFEEISSNLDSQVSPSDRKRVYGSSDQSWSPGKDFENAPEAFQSYKRNFSKHMNKSGGGSSCGSKKKGKKPQKPSDREGTRAKCQRKGPSLNLDKIFEEGQNIKMAEEEDEVFIIDKDTYIKGIRDEAPIQTTKSQKKSEIGPVQELRPEVEDLKKHSENSSSEIFPLNVAQLLSKGQQIISQKLIQLDQDNEMPDNYGTNLVAPEPNPSHSLSSQLSISQEEKGESQLKQNVSNQVSRNDLVMDHQILGMLRLEDPHEIVNDDCQKGALEGQKNPQAPSTVIQMLGKKRPFPIQLDLSAEQDKVTKRRITSQYLALERSQDGSPRRIIQDIDGRKVIASETDKKDSKEADTFLKNPQLASVYLKNTGFKQRIQTQLKHLLESSPIDLQEDESSNPPPHPLTQNINIQKEFPKEEQHNCQECVKIKQSQKLFIDFIKQQLLPADKTNANIQLDQIYCEQQTFLLVNGWNPHVEPTHYRKLVVIEKQSYLQSIIQKNEVQREYYEKVLSNYRLEKVAMVGGDWFGIFRVQKNPLNRKQYCYMRMSQILQVYRKQIVQYLTSVE